MHSSEEGIGNLANRRRVRRDAVLASREHGLFFGTNRVAMTLQPGSRRPGQDIADQAPFGRALRRRPYGGADVAVRELVRSPMFGVGEIDFTVVIPTYNRPQQLIQCLDAISMQAYPKTRYEVIVVDDGSNESMEAAVAPFLGRMSIVLLRQPNSGPADARNAGAAVARGHYVAFTDDDC